MEISQLILKKLENCLSEGESELFEKWLQESPENRSLYSRLNSMVLKGQVVPEITDDETRQAWLKVIRKWEGENKTGRMFKGMNFLKYAAIFAGVLALSYGYWSYRFPNTGGHGIDPETITLQLENGAVRVISPGKSQVISDEKGNRLGTLEDNRLDYTGSGVIERLVYNTLKVPNGKRFDILLSDGTSVLLNAGSTLKYPVNFIRGKNRHVHLTGEAYFDVVKGAQPFIVTSGNMDLRVLGTRFNVTAYPEDIEIKTVLVEGSVSLAGNDTNYEDDSPTVLHPGEKGAWDSATHEFSVEQVDTDLYTGWRDGKLIMKKMRFDDIVKRLQRHYNVSITNEYRELEQRMFTATFQEETIKEVLETFTIETYFDFKMEGNEITIQRPNPKTGSL